MQVVEWGHWAFRLGWAAGRRVAAPAADELTPLVPFPLMPCPLLGFF
jgi:hypothetical protein